MNKLNKAAYMFFIWAVLSLCGCNAKGDTQMYLEAKVQDTQEKEPDAGNDSDTGADMDAEVGNDSDTGADTQADVCFVYVCGAVEHPGVFELPRGSRVYEAVALAGGLCKNAYAKGLNQAKQIEDGEMIEVLTKKEYKELAGKQDAGGAGSAGEDAMQAQSGGLDADGRIDLNTATAQELMELSGIGEAKAANIIAYRESSGGFQSTEEIKNVSGIGEGVYARIQDKIKVIR
ncbi:MAG: helix-hairpin-helix domain-containing protein [Eubacterium sp.]|nr:helix-hairpin-helix domain-containing protein [Eubacterium sp.]